MDVERLKRGQRLRPTVNTEETSPRFIEGHRGRSLIWRRVLSDGALGTEMWSNYDSFRKWVRKHAAVVDAAPDPPSLADELSKIDEMVFRFPQTLRCAGDLRFWIAQAIAELKA